MQMKAAASRLCRGQKSPGSKKSILWNTLIEPEICISLCYEGAKVLPHRDPYGINEVLAQLFNAEMST